MQLLKSVEARRQQIIDKLIREGINESYHGHLLNDLPLTELGLEHQRFKEGRLTSGKQAN